MQNLREFQKGFCITPVKERISGKKYLPNDRITNFEILNMMISQNIIQNFPVRVENIEIEEKIFGPAVSTLKGRTIRKSPKVVVDHLIEIIR